MKPRKVRVRLAIAGLGLSFALSITTHAPAASQASPSPDGPPQIYQKARTFRVPFHFDPAERARRRELQLWVSDDLGRNWKQKGVTTPDRPAFTFNAEHDGEYWLAVRSLDVQGRLFPADDARIVPSMKVIVDTMAPSLVLEPQVRSASLASVRWEVHDENPDPAHPPVLQYQVSGSNEWLPVPIGEAGLLGVATWDTGSLEPLKIRGTAIDRAGNKAETSLGLVSGRPGQAPVAASEPVPVPTPQPNKPAPAPVPDQPPAPVAASEPKTAPAPVADQQPPAPVAASEPKTAPAPVSDQPPASVVASEPKTAPAPVAEQPPAAVAASDPDSAPMPLSTPPGNGPAGLQAVTMRSAEDGSPAVAQALPAPHGGKIAGRDPVASIYPSAQDSASLDQAPVGLERTPPGALPEGEGVVGASSAPRVATGLPGPASPTPTEVAAGGPRETPGPKAERETGPDLQVPRFDSLSKVNPPPQTTDRPAPQDGRADPGVGMAGLSRPAESFGSPESLPPGEINKIKVPGQRFLLDYAIDRAGPDGRPAAVELWVTGDGGKTWSRKLKDPDRVSPILVDLEGEGTFGITLIARDANGLGDTPPAPGDVPKMWIEVEPSPERATRAPKPPQPSVRR